MLKKVSPAAMMSIPMSIGGGYMLYAMPWFLELDPVWGPFNHLFALLGGFAFWLVITGMMDHFMGGGFVLDETPTRSMGPKAIQWLLPIIAVPTGALAAFYGYFLGVTAIHQNETATTIIMIMSAAVAWFGVDLLLYRSQRIVREGWIIFVDGRIYYPGERFHLKHVTRQDFEFVTEMLSVRQQAVEIAGAEGVLTLAMQAQVTLDVGAARTRGIRVTTDDIAVAAGSVIANQLATAASEGVPFEDLLQLPRSESAFDAAGFLFS